MNYLVRLITGLLLAVSTLTISQFQPWVLTTMIMSIQTLAYQELRKACGVTLPSHLMMFSWMVSSYLHLLTGYSQWYALLSAVPLLELSTASHSKNLSDYYPQLIANCFILMVISIGHLHVINLQQNRGWFLLPVICCAVNDAGAYFVGKLMGKTKLCRLSPNKTIEGFIGGLVVTMMTAAALTHPRMVELMYTNDSSMLDTWVTINVNQLTFVVDKVSVYHGLMALLSSTIVPLTILLLSGLKRARNIKDFGSCIPGHGGVVDRVDCIAVGGLIMWVLL